MIDEGKGCMNVRFRKLERVDEEDDFKSMMLSTWYDRIDLNMIFHNPLCPSAS